MKLKIRYLNVFQYYLYIQKEDIPHIHSVTTIFQKLFSTTLTIVLIQKKQNFFFPLRYKVKMFFYTFLHFKWN